MVWFDRSKSNYVCTACRMSRKESWGATVKCPKCKQPMFNLGKKWRVPPRIDDKGWQQIEQFEEDNKHP